MDIKEIKEWSERVSRNGLEFDLLGEHFAIQGDAAAVRQEMLRWLLMRVTTDFTMVSANQRR